MLNFVRLESTRSDNCGRRDCGFIVLDAARWKDIGDGKIYNKIRGPSVKSPSNVWVKSNE